MRTGYLLLACLALAVTAGPAAMAQTTGKAATHSRMNAAGFVPLAEMTFGSRDVRRVLLIDPYAILAIPGIELERHRDGRLTLRAQYRGWTGPPLPVSQAEWDHLASLEAPAFSPPGKNGYQYRPGVTHHCWGGLVEASPDRTASWLGCNSGTKAAQAYTEAVLALAMRKNGCADAGKETVWRFSECFADAHKLDDPALQERLVGLRAQWARQREPGADMLAKARVAFHAAQQAPTEARIAEARDAILAFGRQQEALRTILHSSFAAFPGLVAGGGRNSIIIAWERRGWHEDIEGQTGNYVRLLEAFARLPAGSPTP